MKHTRVLVNSKAIDDISSLKFSTTFDIVPASSSVCVSRSKISSSDGRKQGRYDQTGKTFTEMVKSIFHEERFRTMHYSC